ncbi:type VI secretion system tip protein VgrG [Candidatus Binatia bacterium]|nr:type VI secretion system tip protein VgrG [Candidatus Binatia bacterium]
MAYTQDGRLIAVHTPLGPDALLLQRFSGREAVSELFRFELDLLSDGAEVEPGALLGHAISIALALPDGGSRYFHGVVSRFGEGIWDGRLAHYRAEVVPWLWLLGRTSDSRIFQNQAVPQIIEQVFKDLGLNDYRLVLRGTYEPRDYCVQYRETDLNFVSRLMEECGIAYFFEHRADRHILVMTDAPDAHDPCPHQAEARIEATGRMEREDAITAWDVDDFVRAGAYALADFNFETPNTNLLVDTPGVVKRRSAALALYDYPGGYLTRGEGERVARIRMQEEEATHCTIAGSGRCRGFAAGYRFALQGHFRRELDTEYLLTAVVHDATAGSAYRTGDGVQGAEETYRNGFLCLPHRVPFRPARLTPKPFVEGVQTAFVVGPSGEEIHTDKYGRVRVQFHWDREGKYNEKSSCWVRVAQAWAGKRWGAIFTPRIGQEVIVDFEEGDPDRPLITGRVYNAEQMPPYDLPAEQTKSTIKTSSSKGGGGFNEIRFEDKKGKEQLFVHAERRYDNRVKKDSLEWVGRHRHLIVGRQQREAVKADKHLKVGGDRNEQIDGSASSKVGMDFDRKIGMKRALDAGMEIHLKAGMNAVIEGGMTVTLKAGAGFLVVGPAGVTMSGTPILINAGGAAGTGSGASPDPPKAPLEADRAEPGAKAKVPPPKTVSPQALALRQAAREGRPFCEKCAEAARQAALARGATPAEAEDAAQAAGEQAEKTWVEIELLDEDERPVAGEEYRLDLADGSVRRGRLDANGKARVENIDPGTCELTFPNLDANDWARI